MGKEIERKWLCRLTDELREFLMNPMESYEIKDYYFNQYTRLRLKDDKFLITIKSLGNLVRDEFEFEVDKTKIDFIPSPLLIKKRILYPYKNHLFEINVFKDLMMEKDETTNTNLIIAELELKDKDETFELPEFIGKELTYDSAFYGYNLFNRIKLGSNQVVRQS